MNLYHYLSAIVFFSFDTLFVSCNHIHIKVLGLKSCVCMVMALIMMKAKGTRPTGTCISIHVCSQSSRYWID